jgi:hypothetical protein
MASSRSIGAERVGDQPSGQTVPLLQQAFQQALGGPSVAPALDDLDKYIAVLMVLSR